MSLAESLSFYLSTGTTASVTVSTIETISSTASSTTSTNGALIVGGGVGVGGNLNVANSLYAGSIGSSNFNGNVVTNILSGSGISVNANTGSVTVANSGVISITAGSGISVNANTGSVTVANSGVISITAGTGTAVSVSSGVVTIWSTATSGGGLATTATTAQYWSGTNTANALTPAGVWSAAVPIALVDASTVSIDMSTGINFTLTFTAAVGATRQIGNPTNAKPGQSGWIQLTQSSGGGNSVTFGNQWHWVAGITGTVTTLATATDILYYTALNSSYFVGSMINTII